MTDVTQAVAALRDLLADMHDRAEDRTCLIDNGDGFCFACQCFTHVHHITMGYAALAARVEELEQAIGRDGACCPLCDDGDA